jgi:hypothetical protein
VPQRIAGILQLQINGEVFLAKGNFTTNLGAPMREPIIGADRVHGYKETPQVPFIEGEITDNGSLDRSRLLNTTDATVTLDQANGKLFILRSAWYAGEGSMNTDEANMPCRFEGMGAEEVAT